MTDFQFVPTEWLQRYLESPQAASVIETSDYLCLHGKLDLDKIGQVKMVDSEVVERLYDEVGRGQGRKLTHYAMCMSCVKNRCKQIKLNKDSAEDAKRIALCIREPIKE
jgi:hypothetical protein